MHLCLNKILSNSIMITVHAMLKEIHGFKFCSPIPRTKIEMISFKEDRSAQ